MIEDLLLLQHHMFTVKTLQKLCFAHQTSLLSKRVLTNGVQSTIVLFEKAVSLQMTVICTNTAVTYIGTKKQETQYKGPNPVIIS